MNKSCKNSNQTEKPGAVDCELCNDTELIIKRDDQGYEFASFCDCRERKAWQRRFKNSLIPDEFINCNFENFKIKHEFQSQMYDLALSYLNEFSVIENKKNIPCKNFGLIAVFGEQRLKELPIGERAKIKKQHNNFGVGKTHIQIALAKRLIKDGFKVFVVSDVSFMDELIQAKMLHDEGETINKLISLAINADVLVWDDIGKAKWSEAKESLYYKVINERYKAQKPIVFNSNEDRGTLSEKIGYAAASRLLGQCGPYLLEVEGEDQRLWGDIHV